MSKSYRIRTTLGQNNNGYLKVNVDLNQNYDFLEILSLKISQKDDYKNFCSEYGVVAGRVIVNGGFGVPNVKVSIFVPVQDNDLLDPVKSAIYPYTEPFPDQKNQNGIRYNLLPKNQQTLDHTPVGTFPKKREVLDDSTTLEIYEKYYKYTTVTNSAGDYILFGVPVGDHFLHYDMDVSDIGFLSTRPYELINQGYSEDLFASRFKFKSSNNLDSLPQIFSENIPVTVEPYWCDSLSVGSPLGINRYDIEPNIELTPTSIFMGSVFSDDERDSLNKNCKPAREMGKMNEVITGGGKLEAIRRTVDGNIETFSFKEDSIDENGNWSILVPMNIRKVVTDEFGNLVPSPDGVKGVATEGDYRFRISMDATSNDKRQRQRAKFLVPNTNNNFVYGQFSQKDIREKNLFTINEELSTITDGTQYSNDPTNQYNYLEEFFPFRWKKVYTVKQYIGRFQKLKNDESRGFIGIKDIINAQGVNKFPTNRFDTNLNPIYSILCLLVSLFGHVIGAINGVINIINGLVTQICLIKIPVGLSVKLVYCFQTFGVEFCNNNYKTYCGCSNNDCGSGNNDCGNGCYCGKKLDISVNIKWGCLFSKFLCKKCRPSCNGGTTHSCCPNSYTYGDNNCNASFEEPIGNPAPSCPSCCKDCCIKIPLIPLRCAEEGFVESVSIIKSPFAFDLCNRNYAKPFDCKSCGGRQTRIIKDWVACKLEPVAVFLRMLKFDFYNDWVGGTLYFPLIKRNYKLKKSKRKFGQIKKDKFCDFDCRISGEEEFQGNPTFNQWRIKINNPLFSNPTLTVNGCTAKLRRKQVTDWYGTEENDDQTFNLNLAVKEIKFNGKTPSQDGCTIVFDTFTQLENILNTSNIPYDVKDREVSGVHGKPEYVETDDGSGNTSWENIGGHGHHRNSCDNTRMVERKEFFKTSMDCGAVEGDYDDNSIGTDSGDLQEDQTEEEDVETCGNNYEDCGPDCTEDCGSNGVAPCENIPDEYEDYNNPLMRHGLISWYDNEIYYTPYVPKDDYKENNSEYKANLLLPTTIMELGSTSYCDIDDIPFIMNVLQPTTFQVSFEESKFQIDGSTSFYGGDDPSSVDDGTLKTFTKIEDKKDSSINLRAYVEYGCFKVVCVNINAAVNQSQIGVDIIDKNDIGVEAGNCFIRFDHDVDIRGYFCRRFNGYRGDRTFHHTRPGGIDTDNIYRTYPEMTLIDGGAGDKIYYQMPAEEGGDIILSEYNDSDPFIPGDACGFKKQNGNLDYFYGLAPGVTQNLINYPNGSATLNFGSGAIVDNTQDEINFVTNVSGIRFNRSQTPYHLYFGLVPGKTALHKTVSKFFADKINAITLQGVGASNTTAAQNTNNAPTVDGGQTNTFAVYRTCLGELLTQTANSNSNEQVE